MQKHQLNLVSDLSGNFTNDYTNLVQEPNVCSQQGLTDMFDATIGASTILMPLVVNIS